MTILHDISTASNGDANPNDSSRVISKHMLVIIFDASILYISLSLSLLLLLLLIDSVDDGAAVSCDDNDTDDTDDDDDDDSVDDASIDFDLLSVIILGPNSTSSMMSLLLLSITRYILCTLDPK
jgi:hypothetical protein